MPTPFVHLYISQQILSGDIDSTIVQLRRHAGDFLLGSIAPDAWTLGTLSRAEAHLLPIPIPQDRRGADELLSRYPHLAQASHLRISQAAFVAGYMTHLLMDEIWYHQVFVPFFWDGVSDEPIRRRILLHNALRLHVEDRLERSIRWEYIRALAMIRVEYALPIIPDAVLESWRNAISAELRPGGQKRSAEVFAERMDVPVDELLALVHSADIMQQEVLGRLPDRLIEQVLEEGVVQGRHMTLDYMHSGDGHRDARNIQSADGPRSDKRELQPYHLE